MAQTPASPAQPSPSARADLHATRQRLYAGETSAQAEADASIALAEAPACRNAFLSLRSDVFRAEAAAARPQQPLAGLAVSVKDLFDVAGEPTRAGSVVLDHAAPASSDCPAVARLRAAGGAVMGRTHMVEFAFSGVGTNPHFATPAAWDGRYNTAVGAPGTAHVPGGSSSGAAVSVATGAAFVGLGSDTGGSIRIPAALNGIVGFKSTARLVPTAGAIPLSTTLDTVCAMTRSVRDAITVHEVLAAHTVTRSNAPLPFWRFAVARTTMLDGLDATVARAFERTLDALRSAGAEIVEVPLDAIRDLGAIQSTGGFSAAESYAWHRDLLERAANRYDPRVSARILRGAGMKAHEYVALTQARRAWIARVEADLAGFDAVLSPTVPIVAPTLASVAPGTSSDPVQDAARDDEFFRVNALLLRNTSVVNMLDGCAISLPCHAPGELPVGLMVWHGALRDDAVLNAALQIEQIL
jgi:aspartyl-tRNA(Asn)/glutamyl-tRNA(Gln) amidotransferase subunit A